MKIRLPIIIGLAVLILGSVAFGVMKTWPKEEKRTITNDKAIDLNKQTLTLEQITFAAKKILKQS